jgi:hypothetical protein
MIGRLWRGLTAGRRHPFNFIAVVEHRAVKVVAVDRLYEKSKEGLL